MSKEPRALDSVRPALGAQLPRHSVPEANPLTSLTLGFFISKIETIATGMPIMQSDCLELNNIKKCEVLSTESIQPLGCAL